MTAPLPTLQIRGGRCGCRLVLRRCRGSLHFVLKVIERGFQGTDSVGQRLQTDVRRLPVWGALAGRRLTLAKFAERRLQLGDIILQREVPILPGDTPEALHARIQEVEHVLYPEALAQVFREMGH